jgi:Tol biopolymer transport system component
LAVAAAAVWTLRPDIRARFSPATDQPTNTQAASPSETEAATEVASPSEAAVPSSTVIAVLPTLTFTATLPPEPTQTFTPAPTFTPSPTAQGGGTGQFAFASDRTGMPQIYLGDIASGDSVPLTNLPAGACQPAWSPDGKRIVFTSPCLSRDDTFKNSSLYIMNADGSDIKPLISDPGGDFDPAWAPDGNRLAFVSIRNGRSQVFVYDFASASSTALPNSSSDVEEVRTPSWSPFGNQIVFTAKRFNVYQIWVMADNGQGQQQVVRSGQEYWDLHPAWSPDGQTILFSQRRINVGSRYYLMSIRYEDRADGAASRLNYGPLPIENVHFSPDGFWLIFEGDSADENRDIFLMTVDGGNRARLSLDPAADFDPAWRPILPQ